MWCHLCPGRPTASASSWSAALWNNRQHRHRHRHRCPAAFACCHCGRLGQGQFGLPGHLSQDPLIPTKLAGLGCLRIFTCPRRPHEVGGGCQLREPMDGSPWRRFCCGNPTNVSPPGRASPVADLGDWPFVHRGRVVPRTHQCHPVVLRVLSLGQTRSRRRPQRPGTSRGH